MSEILQDEKKRKKFLIVAIFGVVVIVLGLALYISSAQKKYQPKQKAPVIDVAGKRDDAKEGFIKESTRQFQEEQKKNKERDAKLEELQKIVEDVKQAGKPGIPGMPSFGSRGTTDNPPVYNASMPPPPPLPQQQGGYPNAYPNQAAPVQEKRLSNLIEIETKKPSAKEKEKENKAKEKESGNESASLKGNGGGRDNIPAGTFVQAVLMNGLDAPSGTKGKGSPYPVLLRLTNLAQLPNRFKSDIKECFAVGEAYGELSSERAVVRINTLSCVNKEGKTVDAQVSGYVVGEDGKLGLLGVVVTKQGALIVRSMLAGFLQGVSQAFSQSATIVNVSPTGSTSTIDPNKTVTAGVGSGTSKAAEELAKFYTELAKEMFPVVEVAAGRKVEIVFINRFKLSEVSQ